MEGLVLGVEGWEMIGLKNKNWKNGVRDTSNVYL